MSDPKPLIEKLDPFRLINIGRKRPRRDKRYATFNRRMLAGTLDTLLLMVLQPLFNWLAPIRTDALESLGAPDAQTNYQPLLQILGNRIFVESWLANTSLQVLVFCIFSGICWHYWSATPGKMIMRIKLVDAETGNRPSDRQIVIRLLGYIVSGVLLMAGFFWIGADKKGRAWHDLMAKTLVVTIPWKKKETP